MVQDIYQPRDGTFNEDKDYNATVQFRGEPRRILDLSPTQLRAALLDAHEDLRAIYDQSETLERLEALAEKHPEIREDQDFASLMYSTSIVILTSGRHLTYIDDNDPEISDDTDTVLFL